MTEAYCGFDGTAFSIGLNDPTRRMFGDRYEAEVSHSASADGDVFFLAKALKTGERISVLVKPGETKDIVLGGKVLGSVRHKLPEEV